MIQAFGQLATAGAVASIASNLPRSVSVVHYGSDGVSVATTGRASYADVSSGGGTIRYAAALAGGAPHSTSDIVIDAQGRAVSSETRLLAADGTLRRVVRGDYRSLVLNSAGSTAGGVAQFALAGPDGTPCHFAEMAYANERPASYMLTTYAGGSAEAIAMRVEIGFEDAVFAGMRLVGGELAVTCRTGATLTLASTARSFLSTRGTPDRLLSTIYAEDGATVRELVESSYTRIVFDARGRIRAGVLVVAVQPAGGGSPVRTALRYANGKLISTRVLESRAPLPPRLDAAPARPVPGPWRPARAADRVRRTLRADGSLAQLSEDWLARPRLTPLRSLITGFATDGRTAVRVTDIDYRAARFAADGQPDGGTIISTRFEGGMRSSTTNIVY